MHHRTSIPFALALLSLLFTFTAFAKDRSPKTKPATHPSAKTRPTTQPVADDLFTGPIPVIRIEIPEEGMQVLRQYVQVWRQARPPRIDVKATVREGDRVYKNVAVHLKGTFSFQGIDAKPSLTLNFDKYEADQTFHGLTKVHLNNATQDQTGLCEQFAREIFKDAGVICPRATPAQVNLNGRDLGLSVLIEGANKSFIKRNFKSAKGNLYDGGSGGDVTKDLAVLSGEKPEDRSDLKRLIDATNEPDPDKRLAELEKILDVDHFITFAAIEASIVHWDGYVMSSNNYRVFHDTTRDKLLFMPHGLDQIFGVSNSTAMTLTPIFRGAVAKALFAIPQARQLYLKRIEELSKKQLSTEAMNARVDRLAARLRPALSQPQQAMLDFTARNLKARIFQRVASIAQQLQNPPGAVQFPADGILTLANNWQFKPGTTIPASASKSYQNKRLLLHVNATGEGSNGAWRTSLLLDKGRYEFTGLARTKGLANVKDDNAKSTTGVILRISGEKELKGITISDEFKPLTYTFDVRGIESVELVCEFRGPSGSGEFDSGSLRLIRKGPLPEKPKGSP